MSGFVFGVAVIVNLGVVVTTVPASPVNLKQLAFCAELKVGLSQIDTVLVGEVDKFTFARHVASHARLFLQESTQLFSLAEALSVGVFVGIIVLVGIGVLVTPLGLGAY